MRAEACAWLCRDSRNLGVGIDLLRALVYM